MSQKPSEEQQSIDRIPFLDMLRGISVLGILVVNIQAFSQIELDYVSPGIANPLTTSEIWAYALGYIVADKKFAFLFALLFGVSSWIVASNAQAKETSATRILQRRNLGLLAIGLIHAYLVWDGDILVSYAIAGLLVTPAMNWSIQKQLKIGLVFLAIPLLISVIDISLTSDATRANQLREAIDAIPKEIAAKTGSWSDTHAWRVQSSWKAHLWGLPFTIWSNGGLMLVGMALFRLGIARAVCSRTYYLRWSLAWLAPGVLLTVCAYLYQRSHGFDLATVSLGRGVIAYLGTLMMTLGYLGLGVLFYRWDVKAHLSRVFQAVGKMALTNYLLQSLVGAWLFYGFGLGWFEKLTLTHLGPVMVGIWGLNAALSVIWLRTFAYGPVEWLWRWMTHGQRPTLRKGS